jgi:hypothetical protein
MDRHLDELRVGEKLNIVWTDGSKTMEAEVVSQNGEQVILRYEDGSGDIIDVADGDWHPKTTTELAEILSET